MWGHFECPYFKIPSDDIVSSPGSYVRTYQRIRNSKHAGQTWTYANYCTWLQCSGSNIIMIIIVPQLEYNWCSLIIIWVFFSLTVSYCGGIWTKSLHAMWGVTAKAGGTGQSAIVKKSANIKKQKTNKQTNKTEWDLYVVNFSICCFLSTLICLLSIF